MVCICRGLIESSRVVMLSFPHYQSLRKSLTSQLFCPTGWINSTNKSLPVAKGKSTKVYTQSRCTFGAALDFGVLWKQRGFLTSSGQPVKNGRQDAELLDAILLPSALAIIKVSGHSKPETTETKGNSWADRTTKTAVLQNGDSH